MKKLISIFLLTTFGISAGSAPCAASSGNVIGLTASLSAAEFAAKNGGAIVKNGNGWTTEVTFYTPSVVRVSKYPSQDVFSKKSYSVIMTPEKVDVDVKVGKEGNTVKSSAMGVIISDDGKLSFTDPQGNVLLSEAEWSFSPCANKVDEGKYKVAQSYNLQPEEAIFGLGQRQCPVLNQRGEDVRIWTGNTNITIPYITSEKGYGLYWDNAGDSGFTDKNDVATFSSEVAPGVDYYFIYKDGTQDGVIAGIRTLTGEATMFPIQTLGHWQCRERYKSSDELCDVLDRYRELEIPLDGMVQDWQYWGCDSNWNAMKFVNPHYINKMGDAKWMRYLPNDEDPNAQYPEPRIKSPEEMVSYVHDNNSHLMISIWANFGPWTDQYREMEKIGALLPFETWPRDRGVRPYDPFNPKARDIYWKYLSHLHNMGIDAWWTDSTEPDHFEQPGDADYMTYDGSWRSVKNAFALMTNKGIYEHQRKVKGNNRRSVQMTRCGTFGLQHYGAFSWSGDVVSNWSVMKNQIPSGLNYVICGIPYWNTDIGGFFGWDYGNDPRNPAMQELQVRWMQWGTFMPMMRNHCSSPMVSELYNFGNPGDWAFDAQKEAIELRYRLLPYIYSLAGDVAHHSGTMMRPLVMDFAPDKKAIRLNDQYMFGKAFLVKPVTDPLYTYLDSDKKGHTIYPDVKAGAAPVNVYLPEGGKWYDFWSNEIHEGGKDVKFIAPINRMP
ncbi:MAG: DUF4968 domain-containing protein, partial [Muribaculaceae bacterium]|nr:DUF4968 domain-containing protein [Muribaculaceae bacterium]